MLKQPAMLENFQPHMHLRGKAMALEAILPDGTTQMISYVGNFNFNWMTNYIYADDAAPVLPKGTMIHVTAWHDNTAQQSEQSRSGPVGRLGRPHGRRNGARLGERHLSSATKITDWVAKKGATVATCAGASQQVSEERCGTCSAFASARRRGAIRAVAAARAAARSRPEHHAAPSKAGSRIRTAPSASLLGYYNRNHKQELDIPIGPNNRIEPGGPDRGQPTHFLPGRQWGLFTVKVPKDFGTNKFTWTLTVNGQTRRSRQPRSAVGNLAVKEATGNTPPVLRFETGASVQGPQGHHREYGASSASNPLPLPLSIADDAKLPSGECHGPRPIPVAVTWSKYRGPGNVTFASHQAGGRKDHGRGGVQRQGVHHGYLQRTRRVSAARRRQRSFRRRRRRFPVLLDQRVCQGHGEVAHRKPARENKVISALPEDRR